MSSRARHEKTLPGRARQLPDTPRTKFFPWKRPVPAAYPEYDHEAGHTPLTQPFDMYARIDATFVLYATVMSMAVGWIFLREGITTNPLRLINLVVFWVTFTYVALPRIHQTLTKIYVPDYFIGRTRTADGLLGDPVNLAFEGSEADIHVAMRRAGWVMAEENTLHSARKMVTAFLLRRSYIEAPVSSLFLFGRRHQFAYQQEVGGTTVKRHHIRFWRAPHNWVLPGGHRVTWLGAATYDRSVGLSRFTLQVTHKIDENTDVERDYVVDTLLHIDPTIPVGVIRDYSTSYHHRNGGGDPLRTDGHLPVVDVTGARERSTGSTAILQARHVSTGISYLRGRSLDPRELFAAMKRDWHSAIDDVEQLVRKAGDHHLPPPSVLFVGAMILLQLGALAYLWWDVVSGGWNPSAGPPSTFVAGSGGETLSGWFSIQVFGSDGVLASVGNVDFLVDPLVVSSVILGLQLLFYLGVVRRKRWARLFLMATLAVDSAVRIPDVWAIPVGDVQAGDLLGLGLSGLALLVLTSDAARLWVHTARVVEANRD